MGQFQMHVAGIGDVKYAPTSASWVKVSWEFDHPTSKKRWRVETSLRAYEQNIGWAVGYLEGGLVESGAETRGSRMLETMFRPYKSALIAGWIEVLASNPNALDEAQITSIENSMARNLSKIRGFEDNIGSINRANAELAAEIVRIKARIASVQS